MAAPQTAIQGARPNAEPAPTGLELSVVIPCLNEAEAIGAVVDTARGEIERCRIRGEVIVVDNGSTDGSRSSPGTPVRG